MRNLIQDTVEKIRQQRITPDPRWKYLVKKNCLWLFFAGILFLASLSLAVFFDNIGNLDWDLYSIEHQNRIVYIFSILPYFWIMLIAIFLATAFFEIRKTETGYRYSWLKISFITLGGIAIFGFFVSTFGFGGRLNSGLTQEFPFYRQHLIVTKESQWMRPVKGFLAGTITSASEKNLKLEDLNGENWDIGINEKTLVKPSVSISKNEMIKIIGTKKSDNGFMAKEIRPWAGKGEMNGRQEGSTGSGNRKGARQNTQ
jgi:hypothetical protein